VIVHGHGSLVGFTPETDDELQEMRNTLETDSYQWFGKTLYVETRYAEDVAHVLGVSLGADVT
jgi:hypothetical protein